MRIYIDEAGPFIVLATGADSYSLVLSVSIPSANEDELFYEFLRLRDEWPVKGIEIKGSRLNESQTAQVIEVCKRHDVLVNFVALNMATHDHVTVEDVKKRQADALLAHLTAQHLPSMVRSLEEMADKIRKMPNQLFIQGFATIDLLLKTIQDATLYYAQRIPEEVGDIAWIIDRKNHTLTQMEEMWSTLILPASESRYAREPFIAVEGVDYSHFNKTYGFTMDTVEPQMAKHLDFVRETYGIEPLDHDGIGIDAGKLFRGQRDFKDSLHSLGLQLADILATTLRRALNRHLQIDGWRDFGALIVGRANMGSYFIQLGGQRQELPNRTAALCKLLGARAKSMLVSD